VYYNKKVHYTNTNGNFASPKSAFFKSEVKKKHNWQLFL
jgi:hypothetical protein